MRANCMGNTSVYRTGRIRPLIDNASVMCGTSLITIRNYKYHWIWVLSTEFVQLKFQARDIVQCAENCWLERGAGLRYRHKYR
jgi:hypothetical protein